MPFFDGIGVAIQGRSMPLIRPSPKGCRHNGASAASGDDSIAEAVFDQPRRNDDGRVFLAADGLGRMFTHFDDFAGVYDGQTVAFFGAVLVRTPRIFFSSPTRTTSKSYALTASTAPRTISSGA